ncbi:hypothetical protein [Terrabacter lapilli]|uniref:hypothetical protein n=1 Tax=Terrabacter lapilli TaxID=436231 RepID=UPI0031DBE2DE
MATTLWAGTIWKVFVSLLLVWLASPGKAADAEAVPTAVLAVYEGVSVTFRPPAPEAVAEQGVTAAPVHGALLGHVTAVVDVAFVMLKVALPVLGLWVMEPAKAAEAVAVPTLVLAT